MMFAVAAGLGAVARYVVRAWFDSSIGTLAVNVTGAFLLGWLVAGDGDRDVLWVFGTGFLGSFTTFSTWMWESKEKPSSIGVALVFGLLGAWVGLEVG